MNGSSNEQQLQQLRGMWEWRSTEELLDVWKQNNRNEWRDEVFEVIRQILLTRVESLPEQGEAPAKKERKPSYTTRQTTLILALLVIPIIAWVLIVRSNLAEQVWADETRAISLTQSSDPKRLIYENDLVQISIGYDQFLDYIETHLRNAEVHGDIQWEYRYKGWQAQIDLELSRNNVMLLGSSTEDLVANLLEEGKATVFDKRSQSYVNTIQQRTYVYTCGPLCGGGLYYFYLPDGNLFNPRGTQFLKVQFPWV